MRMHLNCYFAQENLHRLTDQGTRTDLLITDRSIWSVWCTALHRQLHNIVPSVAQGGRVPAGQGESLLIWLQQHPQRLQTNEPTAAKVIPQLSGVPMPRLRLNAQALTLCRIE